MSSHRVVKWFRDYANDIEAVNIHYTLTALGEAPDWNHVRTTHYMPLIGKMMRMKELRLPFNRFGFQGAGRAAITRRNPSRKFAWKL
jgi:hypothetical protein